MKIVVGFPQSIHQLNSVKISLPVCIQHIVLFYQQSLFWDIQRWTCENIWQLCAYTSQGLCEAYYYSTLQYLTCAWKLALDWFFHRGKCLKLVVKYLTMFHVSTQLLKGSVERVNAGCKKKKKKKGGGHLCNPYKYIIPSYLSMQPSS